MIRGTFVLLEGVSQTSSILASSCPLSISQESDVLNLSAACKALQLEFFFLSPTDLSLHQQDVLQLIQSNLEPATTGLETSNRFSSTHRTNKTAKSINHLMFSQLAESLLECYQSMGYQQVSFYEAGVYTPGQYFRKHYDFLPSYPSERARTILVYIGDGLTGGQLAFPLLDVLISPLTGLVVSWSNLDQNHTRSLLSLHESLIVQSGTKVVLTFFASY
jgi:hypothetical protein